MSLFLLLACAATPPGTADSTPDDSAVPDSDPSDTAPYDTGTGPRTGGPCAAYASAVATGVVADAALDELSGLVASRQNPGILWAHEDSGGAPELYALTPTGETVATLELEGVENTDWEDLALGPCEAGWCLYVGDTGTLGTDRDSFAVHVVAEPLLDGTARLSAAPRTLPFRYPDTPEDAEALVVTGSGELIVLSKRDDGTAGVYALPEGADVLAPLATIATGSPDEGLAAEVTAADLWDDPPQLLLRTYFHLYTVGFADPSAPEAPEPVPYALEPQGEAVAWAPEGGFWQVSEWANPTLWYTGCADAAP